MLYHKLHFIADFPVCLYANKLHLGTIQNAQDTLSIEVQDEQKIILEIMPLNSNNFCESMFYAAEIMLAKNMVKTNSNYLEITNYDGTNFEIKVLPIKVLIKKRETIIQTLSTDNKKIVLFDDGKHNLEINTKTKVFNYVLKEKINNIKCDQINKNNNNFLIFYGKTHKNQDYLIIFCNFFCIFEKTANTIEFKKDEIKLLYRQNDIAQHGIVQTYLLKENEFVLSDEYSVYLCDEPKMVSEEQLIPWAFCEAVNIENINLARKYLHQNLNEMLSDEHILTFFGEYDEFVWNKYENTKNSICFLYGKKEKTCKHFLFEISKNKITNITCLD